MTTLVSRSPCSKDELNILYPKSLKLQLVQVVRGPTHWRSRGSPNENLDHARRTLPVSKAGCWEESSRFDGSEPACSQLRGMTLTITINIIVYKNIKRGSLPLNPNCLQNQPKDSSCKNQVMANNILDIDALNKIYPCDRSQIEHRVNIVSGWSIPPGSRVLEVGPGQGDCTVVLAAAVGEQGHVDAVDPAPLDYGVWCTSTCSRRS